MHDLFQSAVHSAEPFLKGSIIDLGLVLVGTPVFWNPAIEPDGEPGVLRVDDEEVEAPPTRRVPV